MDSWFAWVWIVAAILFAIAEVFTQGFFLICFGVGAAVAALAGFWGFAPLTQFATFLVASTVVLLLLRPLVNRINNPNVPAVGIDRMLGKEGIVLETIDPARGIGVVRVNHERWSADSADGIPLAAGTMVQVVAIDGTHLKVRLLP